jgi:hypothetical protein
MLIVKLEHVEEDSSPKIYQRLQKSNVKLKQVEEHKSSFKTYGDLHYSNFKIRPNENLNHKQVI